MIKQKHFLYRHIRLDTMMPFYIGIGTINKRGKIERTMYARAYDKARRNEFWKKVVRKINIRVDIVLVDENYEWIKKKEIEFIKLYGRIDNKTGILVNLTEGGDGQKGFKIKDCTIKKLRNNNLCQKVYVYNAITKEFLGEFHSHADACRKLNIKRSSIGSALHRNSKMSGTWSHFFFSRERVEYIPEKLGKRINIQVLNSANEIIFESSIEREVQKFLNIGGKKLKLALKNKKHQILTAYNCKRKIIRSDGIIYKNMDEAGLHNGCPSGSPIYKVLTKKKENYKGFSFVYEKFVTDEPLLIQYSY